jgi:hypothetical protein
MPTQEFGIIITFWQSPPFASFEVFAVLIITIQDHNDNTICKEATYLNNPTHITKYRFNHETNGRTLPLLTLVDKELQIKFRFLYY